VKCHAVESLLFTDVVGETTDIERFRLNSHMSQCSSCQETDDELRMIIHGLRAETAPVPVTPLFRSRLQHAVVREMSGQRIRKIRARALWAGAAVAAACVFAVTYQQAIGHSRVRFDAATASNAGTPEQVWKLENIAAFHGSPAQTPVSCNGLVFAIEKSGENGTGAVVAVDVHTGKVMWRSSKESYGYLSADSSRLYGVVAADNGGMELAAFDAARGNLLWRRATGGVTAAAVDAGDGVCWTQGNFVEYVAKRSGTLLWRRRLDAGTLASKPVVGAHHIIVANGKRVCCLSYDNRMVWEQSFDRPMTSLIQPQVDCESGKVFVAHREISGSGTLLCLDESSGRVVWRKDNQEYGHVLAADGRLFVRSNIVRALDGRTGHPLWAVRADGCAPLVSSGGLLYLSESADHGTLLALDAQHGTVAHRDRVQGSCNGVIITEGLEVVNSVCGGLYAIRQQRASRDKSDI
jgi:outer membrane protein assembly factor BamB